MNRKYKDSAIIIRAATKEDMKSVAEMFKELADFLNIPEGQRLSAKDIERDGFESQPPAFLCKVAQLTADARPLVGYALYCPTYLPTQGGRALMLEELCVRPGHRRRGVGERLFGTVAKEAATTGCLRLQIHVREWNPARWFYESQQAVNITHSRHVLCYSLFGDALQSFSENVEG